MNVLSSISEDADLRRLFGRFPTGVTALCVLDRDTPIGMTASAFVAISLNPRLCLYASSTARPLGSSCGRASASVSRFSAMATPARRASWRRRQATAFSVWIIMRHLKARCS